MTMANGFPPLAISKELTQHYRMFSRNGRWGTCCDCPRNHNTLEAYPEFCKYTDRSDHQLSADDLAEQFNRYKKDIERKK